MCASKVVLHVHLLDRCSKRPHTRPSTPKPKLPNQTKVMMRPLAPTLVVLLQLSRHKTKEIIPILLELKNYSFNDIPAHVYVTDLDPTHPPTHIGPTRRSITSRPILKSLPSIVLKI